MEKRLEVKRFLEIFLDSHENRIGMLFFVSSKCEVFAKICIVFGLYFCRLLFVNKKTQKSFFDTYHFIYKSS